VHSEPRAGKSSRSRQKRAQRSENAPQVRAKSGGIGEIQVAAKSIATVHQNSGLISVALGCDESSSKCPDQLLSVQGVLNLHHMLNAREAHWQTPVTEAPHL
jgi:hypothetical protein